MLINDGTLGAGIKELKPGAAAPLVSFPYFSTIFAVYTFELAVDTGSLFEINFLQASVAFLEFALFASPSNAVFTSISVTIALFFFFHLSVFFLAVPYLFW